MTDADDDTDIAGAGAGAGVDDGVAAFEKNTTSYMIHSFINLSIHTPSSSSYHQHHHQNHHHRHHHNQNVAVTLAGPLLALYGAAGPERFRGRAHGPTPLRDAEGGGEKVPTFEP